MNKYIAVLSAVLSLVLGGCVTTGVRTTAVVYTEPVYYEPVVRERIVLEAHHTRHGREVSKTTVVEKSTRGGTVVRKTTVVEKVRTVDCSDRNPYRDEYRGPCDWRKNFR